MQTAQIKEKLKELGLTGNEAAVYLALLRCGGASANILAEKSGLYRQAVYDALERLMEKGFASFVHKENKKHFQAYPPGKILQFLKEREEDFAKMMPDLTKISNLPKEDTKVEVHKGNDSGIVKTIYRDVIEELQKRGGEVLISGTQEKKFLEANKTALEQHLRRIREIKCKERIFVEEGDYDFVEGEQTEYKWISKKYFSPAPIYVYGHKVCMLIWANPNYAIIVENKHMAEGYRRQFNMLWKIARRIPGRKRG